jgi:serine/threonine protein kinase
LALSAGHNLGSYRIEKFLTSGGMGDVYLASHERLKRHVAIKVLGDSISGDPVAVQRFRREARAASTLSHPHICTLYDFCQQDGLSYLVLEYLDGVTLEARLKKRRLGLADAVRIGAEVAEALDHAHTRGFVHRDLKPGNVMLTQENGAKVLDFGLVARSPAPFALGIRRGAWEGGHNGGPDRRRYARRHPALHGTGADPGERGRRAHRHIRPGSASL